MGSAHYVKTIRRACEGQHLSVAGLAGVPRPEALVAEWLAEREARGTRIPVVSLLARTRADSGWIEAVAEWLRLRGRRLIVRTRVVLPRSLVSVLVAAHERGAGALVELELAHHRPAVARALLGSGADAAAALLLQAQHLETLDLPVVAHLAPLMPGIHDHLDHLGSDRQGGLVPLLRHVQAADVRRVALEVGELHAEQLEALVDQSRELSATGLLELGRAYGVDPLVMLGDGPVPAGVHRLKPRRARALAHGLEGLARDLGLELTRCGCAAHCDLARSGPPRDGARYEPVLGRDLFAGLEAS